MPTQRLTLELDGITAGDYVAWVHDPEPPALGGSLCSVSLRADALADRVEALIAWSADPPSEPEAAARIAGLPVTPEVRAVRASRTAGRGDDCGERRHIRASRVAAAVH